MQAGKWMHTLVALVAAVMILVLQSKPPQLALTGRTAMVPLDRIGEEGRQRSSVSEPMTPPFPRRAAMPPWHGRSAETPPLAARAGSGPDAGTARALAAPVAATPVAPAPAAMQADAVAPVAPDPAAMPADAVAPVAPAPAAMQVDAAAPVAPAPAAPNSAAPVAAKVVPAAPKPAQHLRSPVKGNERCERIHRDVVLLIKNYIAGHSSGEAAMPRMVNLASAAGGTPATPQPGFGTISAARWTLALAAGLVHAPGTAAGMPRAGSSYDLNLGCRLGSRLEVGAGIGLGRMNGEKGDSGPALLHSGLHMRLFFEPQARLAPFALAGVSWGHYLAAENQPAAGSAVTMARKSAPATRFGAGVAYRLVRSASLEISIEYLQRHKDAGQLKQEGAGKGVWSFKAGLGMALSAPRISARTSAGELAANGAAQK